MNSERRTARFIFACCQCGAEPALKNEIARLRPGFRPAFSRPGFVTFKLPDDFDSTSELRLDSVFARSWGHCLGSVKGDSASVMAVDAMQFIDQVCDASDENRPIHLHAWQRDMAKPGERGFEPGLTPLAEEVGGLIAAVRGENAPTHVNQRAVSGQQVFDCVVVEPGQWWLGWHQASDTASRQPGGFFNVTAPEDAVSRNYLKTAEALAWSKLPIAPGDRCVEIGSARGGSCEALLDAGLVVAGIDPAEMDASLLSRAGFTHVKKRAADMKRREFTGVKWLLADSNVAPRHTLDTVEAIVTHDAVHVQGMLLTLKLIEWKLADELPDYLARVRSWGYRYVVARQLAHNRQDVCVLALRRRALRRLGSAMVRGRRRA